MIDETFYKPGEGLVTRTVTHGMQKSQFEFFGKNGHLPPGKWLLMRDGYVLPFLGAFYRPEHVSAVLVLRRRRKPRNRSKKCHKSIVSDALISLLFSFFIFTGGSFVMQLFRNPDDASALLAACIAALSGILLYVLR